MTPGSSRVISIALTIIVNSHAHNKNRFDVMSFLSTSKAILSGLAIAAVFCTAPAGAGERSYLKSVQGTWSGSGEIVAGKYKNTRFTCDLTGKAPTGVGMELAGKCRVGLFTQVMSATLKKSGKDFRGTFLDGAKGKGLDLKGGRLRGKKMVVNINRKKLTGTMVANLKSRNKLHVSINVRAGGRLVPVIGLTLKRTGELASN